MKVIVMDCGLMLLPEACLCYEWGERISEAV